MTATQPQEPEVAQASLRLNIFTPINLEGDEAHTALQGNAFKRLRPNESADQDAHKISLFKRSRTSESEALLDVPNVKFIFAANNTMWVTLTREQLSVSPVLLLRCSTHKEPHEPVWLSDLEPLRNDDLFYTLFNCLAHTYSIKDEKQFLDLAHAEALREACRVLQINYDKVVRPYFFIPAEYERCVFTCDEDSAVGHLSFVKGRAMFTFFGAVTKWCGLFPYTMGQRAMRIKNVRAYPFVDFHFDGNDLLMQFNTTGRRLEYRFVNKTPGALRQAPALPSYFDKAHA